MQQPHLRELAAALLFVVLLAGFNVPEFTFGRTGLCDAALIPWPGSTPAPAAGPAYPLAEAFLPSGE